MWTATLGYRDHRQPYVERFFETTRGRGPQRSIDFNKLTMEQFFRGTAFEPVRKIVARGQRKLALDGLFQRALGYSTTSPAVLGAAETEAMLGELRAVMTP